MVIYTWRTKKSKNGFKYEVSKLTPRKTPNKIGHYVDTKVIKTNTLKTRARAKGFAQKWVKYYNSKKK